jgi:hypothetical protein
MEACCKSEVKTPKRSHKRGFPSPGLQLNKHLTISTTLMWVVTKAAPAAHVVLGLL